MDGYGQIPIIIAECGWSQTEELINGKIEDIGHIKYGKEHIEQMLATIRDGVNVISFNTWSFIDLLSLGDGMEKRYGLVYVDRYNFEEKSW